MVDETAVAPKAEEKPAEKKVEEAKPKEAPKEAPKAKEEPKVEKKAEPKVEVKKEPAKTQAVEPPRPKGSREIRKVPLSKLRQTAAQRLKEAQNTYAMLTTFNECDMTSLTALRKELGDAFLKAHGARLGFMSAFVKASVMSLNKYPAINAAINGKEIVYHDYMDISVAVSAPKGLLVPVLRNCESMSFSDIEKVLACALLCRTFQIWAIVPRRRKSRSKKWLVAPSPSPMEASLVLCFPLQSLTCHSLRFWDYMQSRADLLWSKTRSKLGP